MEDLVPRPVPGVCEEAFPSIFDVGFGPHRQVRVPGLDAGARSSPPGAGPSNLRRPLQRQEAPPRLELKTPDILPDPAPWPPDGARVRTRDVLGGLIHEYELAAEHRIGGSLPFTCP